MEVIIMDGQTIKACGCEAPIIAEASATMDGNGGLK